MSPSQGRRRRAPCGSESDLCSPESSTRGWPRSRLGRPRRAQTLLLMKSPHCRALCCWFCGPRVPGRGASRRDGRACPVCLAGPVLDPGTGRGGARCPTVPLADTWSARQSGCRGLLGGPGGGAHRALQVLSGLRSLRRDGRLSPGLRLGWGSDAGLPGASWPVATGCLESGRHSSLSPATLPTVPRPPGAHVSLRSCFTRGSSSVWPRPHPRCRVRAAPDGPSKAYSNSPEPMSCKKKKKKKNVLFKRGVLSAHKSLQNLLESFLVETMQTRSRIPRSKKTSFYGQHGEGP